MTDDKSAKRHAPEALFGRGGLKHGGCRGALKCRTISSIIETAADWHAKFRQSLRCGPETIILYGELGERTRKKIK
jgi:hypothetical protein